MAGIVEEMGESVEEPYIPLAGIGCGEGAVIRWVLDCDPEVLRYLDRGKLARQVFAQRTR